MPTMRNLLTKETDVGAGPSRDRLGKSRTVSLQPVNYEQQDSPTKQHSTSFAGSFIASLRRRASKNDSSSKAKNQALAQANKEQSQAERSRQLAKQLILQIEANLVKENLELGKVYITNGTEIIKNGGAGIAIRHCLLEIDTNPNTKV